MGDDPQKTVVNPELRVHGIAVRGDRTRMAEVAAATGATVLVIAIAKASGTVIRDLTARLGTNATNSGTPPSANPPGAPKPVTKKRTGKRPGGQPGRGR